MDGAGRVLSVTDPLNEQTSFVYDGFNDVTSTTDPMGNQTSFGYDGNGNLTSVTDANKNTTSYTYDNMDHRSTRTDPLGNSESFQYDGDGNLTWAKDRKGQLTTFLYDGLNRRIGVQFNDGSRVGYTWDAGNRLIAIADTVSGTISRVYDGLDRLTSETTPQGSVSYTYDADGRRHTMSVSGQTQVSYNFDNASRLTGITQGNSTVSFGYDNAGRRTSLTLPNGVVANYSYDAGSQLTGIVYQGGALAPANLEYTYDLAGRRTSVSGSLASTQLPAAVSNAVYNADNQLTQWGSTSLTYDADGNTLNDGTNTYVWDARNRLVSADNNGAAFAYDALWRRIGKTVPSASTNFLFDGMNPVQEQSGGSVTANLLTGGVDERFTRTDSTGTSNFLTDALGSTVALTDASGNTQVQYSYSPYGSVSITGTTNNSYTYTGREMDGLGIYYYRARYYNPATGRFLSEDPIGFRAGTNLYTYVLDDPIEFIDPVGEAPCLNIPNFLNQMNNGTHGSTTSGHNCAQAVKNGLTAGGLNGNSLHNGPQNYGPGLKNMGFNPIFYTGAQNLLPGDVMIFQPWIGKAGGNGHIQVWNGSQWVSDFLQPNMRDGYPGPGSTYEKNGARYQLYRDPNICP